MGLFCLVNLGSLHDFVGEAFGNVLNVLEALVTGVLGEQVDGLVDATERGDVDGLTLDTTAGTNTGGVFASTAVDDGVDDDLEGVFAGLELDDLEGLADDADALDLLTGVAAVEGNTADQTLDDGRGGLAEKLDLVAAGGVRNEDARLRRLHGDVVFESGVRNGDVGVRPLAEELGLDREGGFKVLSAYFVRSPCFISMGLLAYQSLFLFWFRPRIKIFIGGSSGAN